MKMIVKFVSSPEVRPLCRSVGGRDLDRMLFVLPHMVEALSHGAAYRRPQGLSLAAAKEEAVHVLLTYLRT